MKVLVTGATGFVGHHLVKRLVGMGESVTCLVRATSETGALRALGVTLIQGDITDPQTLVLDGFDAVYHLAGQLTGASRGVLMRINRDGVTHITAACAACDRPPVLLIVSSLAAAGPSDGETPRLESDPAQPISHYGRSKLAGETAARCFAHQVPITILRPPIVYGEGDRPSLELFKQAQRGLYLVPTLRSPIFSVIHVTDLTQVMVRLVESGERLSPSATENPGQGIYFATDPECPNFADFGRRIAAALDTKTRVVRIPSLMVHCFALSGTVFQRLTRRRPQFTRDKAREATAGSWLCSGDKAIAGLNLKLKMSMDDRLRQTAQWYREQGWL